MARDKSIRNNREQDSPRREKTNNLRGKRQLAQLSGYQNITDIMFNGGKNTSNR
jgi:hypothetical protein